MMESALTHYTTALGDLPKPRRQMEMFVLATRTQWQHLTLSHLGERGKQFSRIGRGGFALGGRAYLFDIGPADTMSIASHEGWHQYTQSTFAESLPVWAEEGAAAFMEGHRWSSGAVTFSGWQNIERFDRLREAVEQDELLPLETLLTAAPDQILQMGNEAGITYYAQVWALMHFLREGEQARYAPGLQRMLTDAASGKLSTTVIQTLKQRGQLQSDSRKGGNVIVLARTLGLHVLRVYMNNDLQAFESEYRAFLKQITAAGARQRIAQGQSPLTPAK